MNDLVFGDDAPLLHVMSTMRAMRRLKPDAVPRELIEKLITAATFAPSGGNNQAFTYLVVEDRDRIARLAPLWRRTVEFYITTQSPPDHMSADEWERLTKALQYQTDHFEETPVLMVACYELRDALSRMLHTLDRQRAGFAKLGPWNALSVVRNFRRTIDVGEAASIYPSVQNLLLMARALGLAATMTTWQHDVRTGVQVRARRSRARPRLSRGTGRLAPRKVRAGHAPPRGRHDPLERMVKRRLRATRRTHRTLTGTSRNDAIGQHGCVSRRHMQTRTRTSEPDGT